MEPKLKAKELVEKFKSKVYNSAYGWKGHENAKQCALICVDELIKVTYPESD